MRKIAIITTLLFTILVNNLFSLSWDEESLINKPDSLFKFNAKVEGGVTKVLYHHYQNGDAGTDFDFVTMGGQEILFPFSRVEAGMVIADRHIFNALYQPLIVNTEVTFRDDVTVDQVTFASGTPMDIQYGFSFWRFTYGFDFFKRKDLDVVAGVALQLRNASIIFSEKNGTQSTTSQNLGLVPALYLAAEYRFPSGIGLGFEATGIYASSAFFNGADFQFEGSLLDTSLRVLFPLKNGIDTYVNVRFLGGTSDGVSQYEDRFWTQTIENYSTNNLATLNFSIGLRIR
ncbi:hypothetical protein [Spirochaeta isovalerica]|uniref:Uncharacterized protein n=1 Tax=Spirochaeta isovalerica TaxID=150 RepID=A0A841RDG8_9SPIO|nr:hypothetical protein [Spirochaeta isovalerica]MBB6481431.1 hypothetical protein [Spirochaeta isovalerica]